MTTTTAGPWLARGAVVVVVVSAYANSLTGPFIFDDLRGIVTNPNIRTLLPPASLTAPAGTGASGRPVVAFSLAMNYAIGGLNVVGYHVLNVAVHLGCALALLATVQRGLRMPRVPAHLREQALPIAAGVALVWAAHPLNTDALNHVISRSEALLALFFLLTLYGFFRSVEAGSSPGWAVAAMVCNALGMASKEAMAAAPLVVLLADRALVSGGFTAALRARWRLYAGLAGGWIILAACVLSGDRGASVGLEAGGYTSVSYAMTQVVVVAHYLRLAAWPVPLVLDYGTWPTGESVNLLLVAAPIVGGALLLTVVLLWRNHGVGVPAAAFFLVLAPSSSFVPLSGEVTAEHRMYLPLAAVVLIAVLALAAMLRRAGRRAAGAVIVCVGVGLATAGAWATIQRNEVYRTAESIWMDSLKHRPENARAYAQLGQVYLDARAYDRALSALSEAVRLAPTRGDIRRNYGAALLQLGRFDQAVTELKTAVELAPRDALARFNLGAALAQLGRLREAAEQFEAGLAIEPRDVRAHAALADVLERRGDFTKAEAHRRRAEELGYKRR